MATTIQIKRALNTAVPTSLANGELAWTSNGDILYIGANDAIEPIGGKRYPGTRTANQAIVANSTGMIDNIRYGNSIVNAVVNSIAFTLANSTVTYSLIKPTAAEAVGAYYAKADGSWGQIDLGAADAGGSDTQVQFNDGTVLSGDAGFTYNKTTDVASLSGGLNIGANVILNTVHVKLGNSTINSTSNSEQLTLFTAAHGSTLNSSAIAIGASVLLSTGPLLQLGNTTVNSVANSLTMVSQNSTVSSAFSIGGVTVGANVTLNTTKLFVGNTTANLTANSILISLANSTVIANLTPLALTIGTSVLDSTSLSVQDAVIAGNLTINGTLTNIDTTNLVVEDPLIKLSKNNNAADTLDIGFYGLMDPSGSQDTYAGLFRDATDSKFKLFHLLQTEPTTTVDTAGTGYAQATLVCALQSDNVTITGGSIDCGTF